MAVVISPLELLLDDKNPRFVVLPRKGQSDIRKYLVTYEDVCQLAIAINNYGNLLPGERIVVLQEDGKYVVVEGNRRACSLQMLLSRDLIPDGFEHKIPTVSDSVKGNCHVVEVDVVPDRNAAIALMSKRHIAGVKQWRPIAKKQFFAVNYQSGQSISNLVNITGIKQSEIKGDIIDYRFFLSAYNKYLEDHPDFDREILSLKIDPFLRVFRAKCPFPPGNSTRPSDILKISYDNEYNTISQLEGNLFNQIIQLVFEETMAERINTRNVLTEVNGIIPLLELAVQQPESPLGDGSLDISESDGTSPDQTEEEDKVGSETPEGDDGESDSEDDSGGPGPGDQANGGEDDSGGPAPGGPANGTEDSDGGPAPGGPPPRTFFEAISWRGKIDPSEQSTRGLLFALYELYLLSKYNIGRKKAFEVFPVSTGMILRTVYEQALRLRLEQVGLWRVYLSTINATSFPTLRSIERFIDSGTNKRTTFPSNEIRAAFDSVITNAHRDFLNANIHNPGLISVTPDALEGIARGGMFSLIQGLINLLP